MWSIFGVKLNYIVIRNYVTGPPYWWSYDLSPNTIKSWHGDIMIKLEKSCEYNCNINKEEFRKDVGCHMDGIKGEE